jgi:hypothetical protein
MKNHLVDAKIIGYTSLFTYSTYLFLSAKLNMVTEAEGWYYSEKNSVASSSPFSVARYVSAKRSSVHPSVVGTGFFSLKFNPR